MNQKQTFYFSCSIYIIGGGSVGSFLALKFSKLASVKVITNQHWRGREFQKEIVFVNKRKNRKYLIPCIGWDGVDRFPKNSFIIVATKAYNLKGVFSEIKKRFSFGCKVVLCQNGLGIFTEARKFFSARHIIRVLFWFGVRLEELSQLYFAGGNQVLVYGKNVDKLNDLVLLFRAAKFRVKRVWDCKQAEWQKALSNVAGNALASVHEVSNGELIKNKQFRVHMAKILDEACCVARQDGVLFGKRDRREVFSVFKKTASNYNSMFQDLHRGKQTEIAWLNGRVVDLAKEHGILVPYNKKLTQLILSLEKKRTQG